MLPHQGSFSAILSLYSKQNRANKGYWFWKERTECTFGYTLYCCFTEMLQIEYTLITVFQREYSNWKSSGQYFLLFSWHDGEVGSCFVGRCQFLLSIPCLTASPVHAIELPLCSSTLHKCCTPVVVKLGQIRATSGIWELVAVLFHVLKIWMSDLPFMFLNAVIAERFLNILSWRAGTKCRDFCQLCFSRLFAASQTALRARGACRNTQVPTYRFLLAAMAPPGGGRSSGRSVLVLHRPRCMLISVTP